MNENVRNPKMLRINSKPLAEAFVEEQIEKIKEQVKDGRVLLGHGVDSSVCCSLAKAVAINYLCHVNHGLLRKRSEVLGFKNDLNNLIYVDASNIFRRSG